MSCLKLLSLAAVVVGASSSSSSAAAAAAAIVVDNNNDEVHGRALQESLLCIIGGTKTVPECCEGVTDGICTLLTCIDLNSVTVVDTCNCGQIETACDGVAAFATFVPQITGMCGQVDDCCDDGTTTNGEFNTCFTDAISDGLEMPDFASILPGGIPELGLGPELVEESVDDTTTTTTATVAVAATTTDGATEAPADTTTVGAGTTEAPVDATTTVEATEAPPADATTTEAPADATTTEAPADDATTTEAPPADPTEATEPDAGSDASKFAAISTATSLVVALLAMIFV